MSERQLSAKTKLELINQARTRTWAIVLAHVVCAPAASVYYSCKQGNHLAVAAGTSLFFFGLPFMLFDAGLTALVLAPVVSAFILANKAREARLKLGRITPEEADEMDVDTYIGKNGRSSNITGNSF